MRWPPLSLIALVVVLLAAAPTGATAAEETPGEAPAAETPPPSTGWVPQTPAPEGDGDAPASAQQGSSLGSGENSSSAPSGSEPNPAPEPSSPAPAPTDSYYEPETSAAPATEESTSAPEVNAAPAPEPAPEPVAKAEPKNTVPPSVGGADAVARPTSGVEGELAVSAAAEQVASTVTEDSGGLPWLALILCGLVLLYAGVRLLLGPVEPEFFRSGRFRFVRRVFPGA
ncbi:MAG TPA: hypothetical protein VLI94_12745 [Solirubrobacterales bacterium]|nr:hypothetical protein [Solirubrobacterales bacterium]